MREDGWEKHNNQYEVVYAGLVLRALRGRDTADVQLCGGIRRPANLCGPFPVEKISSSLWFWGVFRGWLARPLAEHLPSRAILRQMGFEDINEMITSSSLFWGLVGEGLRATKHSSQVGDELIATVSRLNSEG